MDIFIGFSIGMAEYGPRTLLGKLEWQKLFFLVTSKESTGKFVDLFSITIYLLIMASLEALGSSACHSADCRVLSK